MPDDALTRWTVSVSEETGRAVRDFLARHGRKQDDLSEFIEEAVRWRVFDQTLAETREKFGDLPPEEVAALVDGALAAVRRTGPSGTR